MAQWKLHDATKLPRRNTRANNCHNILLHVTSPYLAAKKQNVTQTHPHTPDSGVRMNSCCLRSKLEGPRARCCAPDLGNEGCLCVWAYLLRLEDVRPRAWLGACCCEGYPGAARRGLLGPELAVTWRPGPDGTREIWNSISAYGFS